MENSKMHYQTPEFTYGVMVDIYKEIGEDSPSIIE